MNAEPASAAVSTELKRRTLWDMSNRTEHSSCIRSLTAEQMENSRLRAELGVLERAYIGGSYFVNGDCVNHVCLSAARAPAAARCAPGRPESDRGSAAARTRRPSWLQARRCLQTTSAHPPRPQRTGLAASARAPPPATRSATGRDGDISAPSWPLFLPWPPQSLGFPLCLSTQTTSEPACL
jgi:hypothetical protein